MARHTALFAVALLASSSLVRAQHTDPTSGNVGIIYNRETTVNLRITTSRGFLVGMEFGRLHTYYKTTYFHLSIGELRHSKEQRQSADPLLSRTFRPYIFGKQNNAILIRGGWGTKRYLSEKAKQRGVAVGITYTLGPTLALLKPYYLAICYPNPSRPGDCRILHEKYSEENANLFLDENGRIKGASPFTRGLSEISPRPGINASLALHFDWGAFDEFVKAFEVGAMLDAFPTELPILVSSANQRLFVNFFVNLQLGRRK
ncbi:MAG: hypothetical protein NZM43_09155 [Saprospiraceae bacterium]|nr:hypothetical protein [Saprospiraceae bacterium]MDW8484481.1 hypothetical protein [Saprospiraceae bacterium]